MVRRIAVGVWLWTGCLVPNPLWSDGAGTSSASAGITSGGASASSTMQQTEAGTEPGTRGGTGTGTAPPGTDGDPPGVNEFCPALPELPGDAVVVGQGGADAIMGLQQAIVDVGPGGVVGIEPGTYMLAERTIVMDQAGLTVRSTTGDAADVIIDAGETDSVMFSLRASDVTLAGISLRNSVGVGVEVGGDAGNIEGVTLTGLAMSDVRSAVATPRDPVDGQFADDVTVACSRFAVGPQRRVECLPHFAVDVDSGRDWRVRDNLIEDYYCADVGTSAVAVRLTDGSRDAIVERNRFNNVFRGVIFGGEDPALVLEAARQYADMPCGPGYWGHLGGVIRNNLFWNGSDEILESAPADESRTDSAISFWRACDGAAYHNTIISLMDPDEIFASIEYRWEGTTVSVVNNLFTDELRQRSNAVLTLGQGNLEFANVNEVVSPLLGDLHLAPSASAHGAGVPLDAVSDDYEGDARATPPDIGADEGDV